MSPTCWMCFDDMPDVAPRWAAVASLQHCWGGAPSDWRNSVSQIGNNNRTWLPRWKPSADALDQLPHFCYNEEESYTGASLWTPFSEFCA